MLGCGQIWLLSAKDEGIVCPLWLPEVRSSQIKEIVSQNHKDLYLNSLLGPHPQEGRDCLDAAFQQPGFTAGTRGAEVSPRNGAAKPSTICSTVRHPASLKEFIFWSLILIPFFHLRKQLMLQTLDAEKYNPYYKLLDFSYYSLRINLIVWMAKNSFLPLAMTKMPGNKSHCAGEHVYSSTDVYVCLCIWVCLCAGTCVCFQLSPKMTWGATEWMSATEFTLAFFRNFSHQII